MSVDDLHAFFKKLEADESLRREVIALDARSDEERFQALQELAAREGLTVTEEDWRHESVAPAVAALEDETLRSVVGGAGCLNSGAYGVGLAGGGCDQSLGAYGGSGCGQSVGAAGHNGCG
jgi:predicted ribosomally synthesized peptide with nif11-like leader